LLQISNKLLDNLLFLLVEVSTDLVGAERGTLFLYDEENKELFSRVIQGGDTDEIRFPADQGIAGSVLQSGTAVIIEGRYFRR